MGDLVRPPHPGGPRGIPPLAVRTHGDPGRYKREAEAAGVDTTGKVYLSQLANYPGDPKAWVSSRADVAKVCKERGWGCRGAVNVKRSK